jgi:glucose-1-phosphate adenylyltransferase
MNNTVALVLGGGRGARMFPLTQHRSKPAVPIAGKYRLIDIPISNCLNSELRRIFVLTQFNSQSLNSHISQTYKFDIFASSFVSVIAAEQTEASPDWFQGTADAVRQCLVHVRDHRFRDLVILAGDHLYQMDIRKLIDTHRRHVADATVAVTPVPAEETSGLGILKANTHGRITHFEEKPGPDRLSELVSETPGVGQAYLASMGIYVFTRDALARSIADPSLTDFGRHVIPWAVPNMRVQAHVFRGFWRDVGTIRSYYDANLALCDTVPPFDFYDASRPVYTHPRFLPATKVEQCAVRSSLISEGSILVGAQIERAVIGIRSRVGGGAQVRESLLLGADYYETIDDIAQSRLKGVPALGVGSGSVIHRAIVDKNARIGNDVRIVNQDGVSDRDGVNHFIRDGIVVIPKNAVVPDGTVL